MYGELKTPNDECLLGITRRTAFELAKEMNIPARECKITADEVFMSTTAGGIMPVRKVVDVVLSGGKAGTVSMKIHKAFWDAHSRPEFLTPVNYD
jgi:branched-chain amino acid aminotransferase